MSAELRAIAATWLVSGRAAVVVEVVAARGSVPRGPGTRMLVGATHTAGTIGGGRLEWQAVAEARRLLDADDRAPRRAEWPLGAALGQCCGGSVALGWSRLDATAIAAWPVDPPRFHLQLYGAGHVGRAIARALVPLPVTVDWIDEREAEFPGSLHGHGEAWPDHVHVVCVDAVEAEVALAPPGAFFLVLTHEHDLDLRIVEAVLRRGDFGFLGLIGSATKRRRFVHRFEQRGIAPAAVRRMTCPIGVPGIAGKEPEVIAAAVVAQLLQQPGGAGGDDDGGDRTDDRAARRAAFSKSGRSDA